MKKIFYIFVLLLFIGVTASAQKGENAYQPSKSDYFYPGNLVFSYCFYDNTQISVRILNTSKFDFKNAEICITGLDYQGKQIGGIGDAGTKNMNIKAGEEITCLINIKIKTGTVTFKIDACE